MNLKKNLHTISQQISDAKIIVVAVVTVLGTLGSFVFGALNLYLSNKITPVIRRIEAVESRDIGIEETLLDLKDSDARIEGKIDRLLFKLVK